MEGPKAVLITGGTGFIGRHLVKGILTSGMNTKIIVLDNLSNSALKSFASFLCNNGILYPLSSGFAAKINGIKNKERLTFYKVDICDMDKVRGVFENERNTPIAACIHLAAKVSVAESMSNPQETNNINVNGTANIVSCSLGNLIPNFVFTSSAAVYGIPSKLPISELEAARPISQYGESKLRAEEIVAGHSGKYRKAISLRLFNVYGIGQTMEYAGVITKFANRIRKNLPAEIYGDGLQIRDFVSVEDVVISIMLAAGLRPGSQNFPESIQKNPVNVKGGEEENSNERVKEAYNIGTGVPTKIKELATIMTTIIGQSSRTTAIPVYRDRVPGDIFESYADISKAKRILGYVPSIGLVSGLKRMLTQRNDST